MVPHTRDILKVFYMVPHLFLLISGRLYMLIQDSNRYYGQYDLNPLRFSRVQKSLAGTNQLNFF